MMSSEIKNKHMFMRSIINESDIPFMINTVDIMDQEKRNLLQFKEDKTDKKYFKMIDS